MDFLEALLNVLAIIGIIVAAAFIIFFLGDLLLSVLEPRRQKQNEEHYKQLTNTDDSNNKEINYSSYEEYSKTKNNSNDMGTVTAFVPEPETENINQQSEPTAVNYEEAINERRHLGFDDDSTNFISNNNEVVVSNEKSNENDSDPDLDNLFNEQDFNFSDDFDFNFGDEETQKEITEINEHIEETDKLAEPLVVAEKTTKNDIQTATNYDYVQISQDENPVNMINVVNDDNAVKQAELNAKMQEEIEKLRQELANQKNEYERLRLEAENNKEKLENEKEQLEQLYKSAEEEIQKEKEIAKTPLLSLEEYEARLEVLKARLKANEKELKANKREFLPLRKVRKTLDNDKKKLRRREALVAKQKVILYGVNNIMEIDEAKAKKLAEDLDLLDGLKVSVQHCEEVMEANKERYPILETTYRILTSVNQDLKDDIAECEENIAKLKAEANGDEGAILEAKNIVNGRNLENKNIANDNFVEKDANLKNDNLTNVKEDNNINLVSNIESQNEKNNNNLKEELVEVAVSKPNKKNEKNKSNNTIISPVAAELIEVTQNANNEEQGLETNLIDDEKKAENLSSNDDYSVVDNSNNDFDKEFLNSVNDEKNAENQDKSVSSEDDKNLINDFNLDENSDTNDNPFNFEEEFATFEQYQSQLKNKKDENNLTETKDENSGEDKTKKDKKKSSSNTDKKEQRRKGGRPRKEDIGDIDDIL